MLALAPVEIPQADRKLVAWWKLDEDSGTTAADSSGNNCAGTLMGEPQWQPSGGKAGGALQFDGNDYIEIANEANFDLTAQITVMAWIKVSTFDKSFQSIVTKGDSAWRLQRDGQEDNLEFACTGVLTDNVVGKVSGKVNVNDGSWHHAAGIYDGIKLYLYVDGKVDNSGAASGLISNNDEHVLIGQNAEKTERQWNGFIDDVRIYNYALCEADVAAIYAGRTLATGREEPGRRSNWIPVLVIVIIAVVAAGIATRRKKATT